MSNDWIPELHPELEAEASPITEKFDPTWPYKFKWIHNGETGEAHAWKTRGGLDGVPVHRQEAENIWGRRPQVREGDRLGMATYIPPEMKMDGSMVAPAHVLLHSYYDLDTPDSVFNWFQQKFPDAVVRPAAVTKDFKGR